MANIFDAIKNARNKVGSFVNNAADKAYGLTQDINRGARIAAPVAKQAVNTAADFAYDQKRQFQANPRQYAQNTLDFTQDFVQDIPRSMVTRPVAAITNQVIGNKKFTPRTRSAKFLFGDQPIRQVTDSDFTDVLKSRGVAPDKAAKLGMLGFAGSVASDWLPGGKGAKVAAKEAVIPFLTKVAKEKSGAALSNLARKSIPEFANLPVKTRKAMLEGMKAADTEQAAKAVIDRYIPPKKPIPTVFNPRPQINVAPPKVMSPRVIPENAKALGNFVEASTEQLLDLNADFAKYVDQARIGGGLTKDNQIVSGIVPQLEDDVRFAIDKMGVKMDAKRSLDDAAEEAMARIQQSLQRRRQAPLGAQQAFGAVAGLEPELDENGKPTGKMKFNPQNALLGIGATTAYSKFSGKGKIPPNAKVLAAAEQITGQPKVKAPFFNVNRMGVDDATKAGVKQSLPGLKGAIDEVTGKPLTFKEVQARSEMSNTLGKTYTRADAEKIGAEGLALRNKLAEYAEMGLNSEQYKEALIRDKAFGQFVGRLLGQRRITSDPNARTMFNEMISTILKKGADPEEVVAAAKNVDFNNAKQATEFYRKYVKTTPGDWLDLLRYNSMLSSPATQFANIGSNFQGTGLLAPIEKTLTGTIDFLGSMGKGKQNQFAGEGAAYAKGYYSNVGNAAKKFANVLKGVDFNSNPDVRNIPLATKGVGKVVEGTLGVPMKILEGMDQFFTTLTEGGSRSALNYRIKKGGTVPNIDEAAANEAAYRVFRGDLGGKGENAILNAFDTITQKIDGLRQADNPLVRQISKFTIPFLKTPANILKQGVEYSPFGLATIPGAANPQQQLSKAILGASVAAGTATLLSSGRLTWAEPTNKDQKAAFRAAGMQPYSVKVGDNWYSYTKMHPVISMNMAFISAIDDAQKQRKLSESDADTLLNGFAKVMNFYADASYAKNIGDFVGGLKGDTDDFSRLASNYPTQLVPYRALLSWINRAVDPVQRQADPDGSQFTKMLQNMMAQMPGLSQNVPPRLGPDDQPIENQNRALNAFIPLTGIGRVTTENPIYKQAYETKQALGQVRRDNKEKNASNKELIRQYEQTGDKRLIQGIPADKVREELKTIKKEKKKKVLSPQEAVLEGATKEEKKRLEELGYQAEGRPIDAAALLTAAEKAQASSGTAESKMTPSRYNSVEDKELASAQFSQDLAMAKDADIPVEEIVDLYRNRIDDLANYYRTLDPELDATERTRTESSIQSLTRDVQKYNSYGGFKKPKVGRGKATTQAIAAQKAKFSLEADQLKRSGDTQGYLRNLGQRYQYLEQLKRTATSEAETINYENQQGDLLAQAQKIREQGALTAPRRVKAPTKAAIKSPTRAARRASRVRRPVRKPRVNTSQLRSGR